MNALKNKSTGLVIGLAVLLAAAGASAQRMYTYRQWGRGRTEAEAANNAYQGAYQALEPRCRARGLTVIVYQGQRVSCGNGACWYDFQWTCQ